ncbi:MAG: PEP/pyruvate-binding domain-containing protein, partial [Candidatus Desantisbacteria bacterium]
MYVKWDDARIALIDEVGTKSHYLSKLTRLGLRTPAGFTLTTGAFMDFISANGIYDNLTELLVNLPAQPEGIKETT